MVTIYVHNTNTGACQQVRCRTAETARAVIEQATRTTARVVTWDGEGLDLALLAA